MKSPFLVLYTIIFQGKMTQFFDFLCKSKKKHVRVGVLKIIQKIILQYE